MLLQTGIILRSAANPLKFTHIENYFCKCFKPFFFPFQHRYRCLLKGRIPRGAPTKEISRVILDNYSSTYERDSYALGSSKVFLRENLESVLEKTRQDIQEVLGHSIKLNNFEPPLSWALISFVTVLHKCDAVLACRFYEGFLLFFLVFFMNVISFYKY